MKKIQIIILIFMLAHVGCSKDTFFDKFVPEILYYQNKDVENADFSEVTLPVGITQDTVKARVSAPMKLKEIKLFKIGTTGNEELLQTYSDFHLSPNVFRLNYILTDITSETIIKIVAWDLDDKKSAKNFTVKITQ